MCVLCLISNTDVSIRKKKPCIGEGFTLIFYICYSKTSLANISCWRNTAVISMANHVVLQQTSAWTHRDMSILLNQQGGPSNVRLPYVTLRASWNVPCVNKVSCHFIVLLSNMLQVSFCIVLSNEASCWQWYHSKRPEHLDSSEVQLDVTNLSGEPEGGKQPQARKD